MQTADSSLAARELNFLVRLAQAAAATQRPGQLRELIIRETTSANGAAVAGVLERSELRRRTEVQLAEIQLSHDIHERFTKLSLDGAGIRSILEVIGSLAGGRAALYSADGYRVRGAGEHSDGMPQRIHVPVLGAAAREVRVNAGRPARPLDVVPVRAGAETLALLAVVADEESVDAAGRLRALEHGSTVLALELAKERRAAA